ncbi:MAG: type II secretion system F family protein [Tyzzerella sp.]|nr:type II secretion system F family protein [Tyzzerella sp.]
MKYKIRKNYWQQDIAKHEYARAILQGILLITIVSYLFYGTVLYAILLSPYLIWYVKSWERQMIQRKKQAFQMQFKEAIQSLSAALNVGYSVENAMRETWKDLQLLYKNDERILGEFRYMIRQLEMNLTVEVILKEFAIRTGDEEALMFVTVFSMAKRSGGDMIAIIRDAVYQIGEKIDVKREIHTMMASKKLEFKIMSAVPFAMICYIKISFPEFLDVLYGNVIGVIVMSVCLVVYVGAFELGKRIVEVEV